MFFHPQYSPSIHEHSGNKRVSEHDSFCVFWFVWNPTDAFWSKECGNSLLQVSPSWWCHPTHRWSRWPHRPLGPNPRGTLPIRKQTQRQEDHLVKNTMDYLRFKIDQEPGPCLYPADKGWPQPKTGKDLATALGFFRYYREFLPKYAELDGWDEQIWKVSIVGTSTPGHQKCKIGSKILKIFLQTQKADAVHTPCLCAKQNYNSFKGVLLALDYGLKRFSRFLHQGIFTGKSDNTTGVQWKTMQADKR